MDIEFIKKSTNIEIQLGEQYHIKINQCRYNYNKCQLIGKCTVQYSTVEYSPVD